MHARKRVAGTKGGIHAPAARPHFRYFTVGADAFRRLHDDRHPKRTEFPVWASGEESKQKRRRDAHPLPPPHSVFDVRVTNGEGQLGEKIKGFDWTLLSVLTEMSGSLGGTLKPRRGTWRIKAKMVRR